MSSIRVPATYVACTLTPPLCTLAATISAARASEREKTLQTMAYLQRINPFAESHHSDSISVASSPDAVRFPSASDRAVFKREVAAFYGLEVKDDDSKLRDMLGNVSNFSDVTLVLIWPASYTNWGDRCSSLALPAYFYMNPRNFLLLPKPLHDAFDRGYVVFVPSKEHITIRVIRREKVTLEVSDVDTRKLAIPAAGKTPARLLCTTR